MSSTVPLPQREQLCNRYCINKQQLSFSPSPALDGFSSSSSSSSSWLKSSASFVSHVDESRAFSAAQSPCRRQRCCNAGANPQPQLAGSLDNCHGKLVLAQAAALLPTQAHTRSLTQAPRTTAAASSSYRNSTAFICAFKRSQVSPSASSSSQDQQAQQPSKSVIPTQRRVTEQLTNNWAPFKALRQH